MKRPIFQQLTEEDRAYYQERSFMNLVLFYARELQQIAHGQTALDVLSTRERFILRKRGILFLQGKGIVGRRLLLTPKAKRLLLQHTRT